MRSCWFALVLLCARSASAADEQMDMTMGQSQFESLTAATTPAAAKGQVPLGIAWNVHPRVGYGVLGINLFDQLWHGGAEPGSFHPMLVVRPHSQAIVGEYPAARAFRTIYATQQALLEGWERGRSRREVPLGFPLLHALEAGMDPDQEPGVHVWGSKNAAFCFLETRSLSPAWVAKASQYDLVLSGSEWNTRLLREKGVARAQTAWQGVNTEIFAPAAEGAAAEAPLDARLAGKFVVFSGGKLEWRKGQDRVVAAFRRFIADGAHPDAVLVYAWHNQWPEAMRSIADEGLVRGVPATATAADGATTIELEAWLADNGVPATRAFNLGDSDQARLARAFRASGVALFPNRVEGGTNLVAMEAMAAGVPVVISNNTGHVDIVRQDGAEHAFPFDASGTEEEACDAMMQQLQRAYDDRAEARRRGANAARFIRREFSWQVAVRRVVALLRDAGFADNNPATLSWDAEAQQVLVAESAGASVLGAPWWLLPSLAFPVALLLLKAAGWRRGAQRKAALRPVLAAIYAVHNPEMLEGPGAEALLSTFSGQERDLLDRIAKKYDLTQQQQAQCDAFVVAHGL